MQGEKLARLTAKEFKSQLPAEFTPKQKRAAYDEYSAQFSTSVSAAVAAALSSGQFLGKSLKRMKSGGLTVTLTAVKERSPSGMAVLKSENQKLAARLAELEAKLAATPELAAV